MLSVDDVLCMETSNSGCTKCYQSYPNTSGVCTAVTSPDANSIYYTNATTIGRCKDGFIVSSGACTAVSGTGSTNAAQGSLSGSTFTPTSCLTGYSVVTANSATTCVATTTTNCTVTNCTACSSASVCTICDSTHFLTVASSTTTCAATAPTNCAVAASTTACTTCMPTYYISSGSCVKGVVSFFGKLLSLLLVFIF